MDIRSPDSIPRPSTNSLAMCRVGCREVKLANRDDTNRRQMVWKMGIEEDFDCHVPISHTCPNPGAWI